jgi:hypothetical protein
MFVFLGDVMFENYYLFEQYYKFIQNQMFWIGIIQEIKNMS